jgi:hypothetical protein
VQRVGLGWRRSNHGVAPPPPPQLPPLASPRPPHAPATQHVPPPACRPAPPRSSRLLVRRRFRLLSPAGVELQLESCTIGSSFMRVSFRCLRLRARWAYAGARRVERSAERGRLHAAAGGLEKFEGTTKKALQINLDQNLYGSFAEIGAGQEVGLVPPVALAEGRGPSPLGESLVRTLHTRALPANSSTFRSYHPFTCTWAATVLQVARWFFSVGAAAGTVAKSVSAYDMTISDSFYGACDRCALSALPMDRHGRFRVSM